ncbi:MAG TPA: site-specific DNA-methyltransferase [Anaerolineales bacterium]|nr:site-specific DNA-methyltransferase [Anaerolineales bacterium]
MPILNWDTKTPPAQLPAQLDTRAVIYPCGVGYPDSPAADTLVQGDNLAVMSALLEAYAGKIDLIYADPPFFTNRAFPARIGQGEDSRRPQDWKLGVGYPDRWVRLEDYLDMLYPRLALMHRLLAPTGTLYLHLDWHADAYARLLLDEIFGAERLLNEIIWVYHGPSPIRSAFNRKHDTILAYTKSSDYNFNADAVREPYNPNTVKTFNSSRKAGFGKVPNLARGKVPEDWWYFPVVARLHAERTGYPTQKPEALLERIILASSKPGDTVADFFCGSGTTPVVASRLGRSYLASDLTPQAIHTTQARLIERGAPAFQLKQIAGSAPPTPENNSTSPVRRAGNQLILDESCLEELVFWDIDPAWDGHVYRSAAQSIRTRRQPPASGIELPGLGEQVCARIIRTSGKEQYYLVS